jgi:hypothetical protein
VTPIYTPVWIAGLVRLLRDPAVRWARATGVTWLVLLVAFVATGAKPYYLALTMPMLIGAGAAPAVDWLWRGSASRRRGWAVAFAVSAVIDAVVTLPVLPVGVLHDTPVVAMNYDAGETVGWPRFVAAVAAGYEHVPAADRRHTVVLTGNYGEAGAVRRYGARYGLPTAYSGHNGFGLWGPPPADTVSVVAVGLTADYLRRFFATVTPVAVVDNAVDVDNEEQGRRVLVARGPLQPWAQMWPHLRHVG